LGRRCCSSADELKEHTNAGVVDLHVAFSRHDGKKSYVQDLLKQQASALWPLIEQGAILYVCGDGGRMEPDVKRALVAMYRDKTGNDEAAGEAWMTKLAADHRYVLDVWASS
jgi:cytochrome P450/NADPH-cytochrome P450 reductase